MIVVIQCAATKREDAGCLIAANGKPVLFVADPVAAPADGVHIFARPDDPSDYGKSWRDVLLEYNMEPSRNRQGLSTAWHLYGNGVYRRLMDKFGGDRLYILSAGWGLISAEFLTPAYDITFSQSAEAYKRRRKHDQYNDFCMLPQCVSEEIVFLGGKDYIPLFCSITSGVPVPKTVLFNSVHAPDTPGCVARRFETPIRTNWHYNAANALIEERI